MNDKQDYPDNATGKNNSIEKYIVDTSMMNDVRFKASLKDNPELATFILRIILNKDDLVVDKITTQESLDSLIGRSIILDAHATDSNKRHYNIEMQKAKKSNLTLRSRLHLSLLDANNIFPGDDFSLLPETYVIFFCNFDIFNKGKSIYFVERYIDGEELFNDLEHIIFINCKYNDTSTSIGKLIHDIKSQIGEEKCYNIFEKNDEGGIDKMGPVSEQIMKDGIKIGREELGLEVIIGMLKEGIAIDTISRITKKSNSYILSIKNKNNL